MSARRRPKRPKKKEEQLKAWRERQQKEQQREEQKASREAAKVEKALQVLRTRAKEEGILESREYGDGVWYVEIAPGTWKSVESSYLCRYCDAPLEESTLASHLDGARHRKRIAYHPQGAEPGLAEEIARTPSHLPTISQPPGNGVATLQRWQVLDEHGNIQCIACKKICDGVHETTPDHEHRLLNYLRMLEMDYAPPEEPWLAWVECKEWGEGRWLRCLLCSKWVQDHEGTSTAGYHGSHGRLGLGNQKDHKKKIEDVDAYKRYNNSSWVAMLSERQKWHPPSNSSYEQPAPPKLPEGWRAVWSQEQLKYYFHNGLVSQWEMPIVDVIISSPAPPLGQEEDEC